MPVSTKSPNLLIQPRSLSVNSKLPLLILLTTFATISLSAPVSAQDRTQRREFVQDLLKGLLESQLERARDPRQDIFPGQFPPQQNPWPGPNRPVQPGRPGQPVEVAVSPEMIQIRNSLAGWNTAAGNLVAELRHHESESPKIRRLLADAIKFQANVATVTRRAQLLPSYQAMTNDFVALDREWRVLSTRLKQTRGLPANCMGMMTTINDLDTNLCGLFQVQPQINRVELARLATTLASDYDHLLRGVYFSARGKRGGEQLMRQGQELQSMIGQASTLIHRGDYDSIVAAFRTCTAQWRTFSRQVLQLQDERLRFSVQHIEDTGRKIQEQLWLPIEIDREYLASLANAISVDAQRVFDSVSMGQLMASPQPGNVLSLAREFQQSCETLSRQLANGATEDQLEWTYRLFASRWNRLHDEFHQFRIPEVDHRLEDIQFSVNAFAEVFGNEVVVGRDELVRVYAELDALCKQANRDIRRRVTSRKYGDVFRDQLLGVSDGLASAVHNIHQSSFLPNYQPSAVQLGPMFQTWNSMRPMLAQCQADDLEHFGNFRRQIEPLMVKLQVLYGN